MIIPMIDWEERAKSAELARDEAFNFVAAILTAAGLEAQDIRVLPKHLEDGPWILNRKDDPADGAIVVRFDRSRA